MRKKILFRSLYAGSLVLIPLGGLEFMTRVLSLGPELIEGPKIYYKAEHLPFMNRPSISYRTQTPEYKIEYVTNRQGFRDAEHSFQKPKGVIRILGLGDSFTYGIGAKFEETYLSRLEYRLNQKMRPPQKVEIIKAGVPAYEARSERLLFEFYGQRYHPDVVMVAFVPNDIYEIVLGAKYEITKDGCLLSHEGHQLGPAAFWLYRHSRAARIFLKKCAETMFRLKYPEPKNLDTYINEDGWRLTENEYEKILEICQKLKARMVVINIPFVGPWQRSDLYTSQRLGRWCQKRHVYFVDILDKMRTLKEPERLYWKRDKHCNPAGYEFIADCIAQALTENKVLE